MAADSSVSLSGGLRPQLGLLRPAKHSQQTQHAGISVTTGNLPMHGHQSCCGCAGMYVRMVWYTILLLLEYDTMPQAASG